MVAPGPSGGPNLSTVVQRSTNLLGWTGLLIRLSPISIVGDSLSPMSSRSEGGPASMSVPDAEELLKLKAQLTATLLKHVNCE